MKLMTDQQDQSLVPVESEMNRRQAPRMNGEFALTFSGMDDGQMVIGDGQVFDLSQGGMAVLANRLVKPGMELALFIELPDAEEHLCVPEARVSWVRGRRFGIALRTLRLEDRNRLRYFLWVHQGPMSV